MKIQQVSGSGDKIPVPMVGGIMTELLESINSSATAQQAAQQMKKRNVSSLVVLYEDGRAAGIITERDFVRQLCTTNKTSDSTKVIELLSAPVKTVGPESSVNEAADKMVRNKVRHLVVVDKEKKAIGIVSATDIVACIREYSVAMKMADMDVIEELEREGRFYF